VRTSWKPDGFSFGCSQLDCRTDLFSRQAAVWASTCRKHSSDRIDEFTTQRIIFFVSCGMHKAHCSASIRCTDTSSRGTPLLGLALFLCALFWTGHGVGYRSVVQTQRLEAQHSKVRFFFGEPCGGFKVLCWVLKWCTDTSLR
jgi:hypothetical protein